MARSNDWLKCDGITSDGKSCGNTTSVDGDWGPPFIMHLDDSGEEAHYCTHHDPKDPEYSNDYQAWKATHLVHLRKRLNACGWDAHWSKTLPGAREFFRVFSIENDYYLSLEGQDTASWLKAVESLERGVIPSGAHGDGDPRPAKSVGARTAIRTDPKVWAASSTHIPDFLAAQYVESDRHKIKGSDLLQNFNDYMTNMDPEFIANSIGYAKFYNALRALGITVETETVRQGRYKNNMTFVRGLKEKE